MPPMHNNTFPSNTDRSIVKENTEPTHNQLLASNTDLSNVKENTPPGHNETVVSNTDASNVKENTAARQCEGTKNNPEQKTSTPPMNMETITRHIESTTAPSYVLKKPAQERNNQSDKSTDGTMDAMNMSFLLCLDVAKLQSLPTTIARRFRKETKQFWGVVYHICHGKELCVFWIQKSRLCSKWIICL